MLLNKFINETPQYTEGKKLESAYLSKHMTKHIEEQMNMPDNSTSYGNNMYSTLTKTGKIYFYATSKGDVMHLIAAVSGKREEHHDNKKMFRTSLTKKYDSTFANAALKLYSFISRSPKIDVEYLISDEEHTDPSKRNWQKWLTDPKRYGIKEIYLYNTDVKKRIENVTNLDDYWGSDEKYRDYRVIVKF